MLHIIVSTLAARLDIELELPSAGLSPNLMASPYEPAFGSSCSCSREKSPCSVKSAVIKPNNETLLLKGCNTQGRQGLVDKNHKIPLSLLSTEMLFWHHTFAGSHQQSVPRMLGLVFPPPSPLAIALSRFNRTLQDQPQSLQLILSP